MFFFIRKIIIFFFFSCLLFYIKPIYLLYDNRYQDIVAAKGVYLSIDVSCKKSNAKYFILGDSVGKQFFQIKNNNDTLVSVACNQAIDVIGQYILLNNYIKKTNNRPTKVFLIITPFSLNNSLDNIYTYNYFLKPFYKKKYLKYYNQNALNQVEKIPFYWLSQEPYVLTSNWSPELRTKKKSTGFISSLSKDYLLKIYNLCENHNIGFHLIPSPVKKSRKKEVDLIDRSEYDNFILKKQLDNFLDNVIYEDDSCFIDHVHLKKDKIDRTLFEKTLTSQAEN